MARVSQTPESIGRSSIILLQSPPPHDEPETVVTKLQGDPTADRMSALTGKVTGKVGHFRGISAKFIENADSLFWVSLGFIGYCWVPAGKVTGKVEEVQYQIS